jgi:hypothetical protein
LRLRDRFRLVVDRDDCARLLVFPHLHVGRIEIQELDLVFLGFQKFARDVRLGFAEQQAPLLFRSRRARAMRGSVRAQADDVFGASGLDFSQCAMRRLSPMSWISGVG